MIENVIQNEEVLQSQERELFTELTNLDFVWVLVVTAYFLVEVIFYAWYRRELAKAQKPRESPKLSAEERDFIFTKILAHAEEYGMWRQVQGWFLTQDRTTTHGPHEIGHENLCDLLSWAFFYSELNDLNPEDKEWIAFAADRIARDFNLSKDGLPDGRTYVDCVKHTLDPIQCLHRPLCFYCAVWLLGQLNGLLLVCQGFRRGHHKSIHYWYRLPKSASQDNTTESTQDTILNTGSVEPMVFFHGIGFGLIQYLPLLLRLKKKEQIYFEMPWVAMNPFACILSPQEYSANIAEVFDKHGIKRAVLVGHSFGSLPVAWMLRRFPEFVTRCVLVDPVCIFLNLPDVCVNFLYKRPRSLHGMLLRYIGSREFGIARCLMRHFFWTDSVLFPEMLPAGSSIVLGEHDHILPARDIYTSAVKCPDIDTVVLAGLDHGHFLMSFAAVRLIVRHINQSQNPKTVL